MPEIRLEDGARRQIRKEARTELPPEVVSRLDSAYRIRPGTDTLEATATYFNGFSGRLRTHIRKLESERAHAELPSFVARWFERTLPGTIPGGATGYFQFFAERLWARIRTSSASVHVPAWLSDALQKASARSTANDADYFATFAARVNERIHTGEVVADWFNRVMLYKAWTMPVDQKEYFHSFAGRVHARIEGHEDYVPDWLHERLSTAEFALPKADSPSVAGHLAADRPARKRAKIHRLQQPVVQWAVAAAICLLLSIGVLINVHTSSDALVAPRSFEEAWLLQQSLSGGSAFVEDFAAEPGVLVDINAESVGGRAVGYELQGASTDELNYIIENLRTD